MSYNCWVNHINSNGRDKYSIMSVEKGKCDLYEINSSYCLHFYSVLHVLRLFPVGNLRSRVLSVACFRGHGISFVMSNLIP